MPKIVQRFTWQEHKKKWSNCTLCKLCEKRNKVVLARGELPCDVLFLGEASGPSEDVIGQPFVGPAGRLLDEIIEQGIRIHNAGIKIGFTNLISCIPKGDDNNKFGEPPDYAIKACSPRLVEFVNIAKPQVIVLVGKHAQKEISGQSMFGECNWAYQENDMITFVYIVHPAFILRSDISQRGLQIQRCVVALEEMVENFVPF